MGVAPLHSKFPIISDGLRDNFVERREMHIAKIAEGAGGIEENGRRVVWPERADFRLRVIVELHRPDDRIVEILDRHIASRGEMVSAVSGPVGGGDNDTGEVMHKNEIAPSLGDEATFSL